MGKKKRKTPGRRTIRREASARTIKEEIRRNKTEPARWGSSGVWELDQAMGEGPWTRSIRAGIGRGLGSGGGR